MEDKALKSLECQCDVLYKKRTREVSFFLISCGLDTLMFQNIYRSRER